MKSDRLWKRNLLGDFDLHIKGFFYSKQFSLSAATQIKLNCKILGMYGTLTCMEKGKVNHFSFWSLQIHLPLVYN